MRECSRCVLAGAVWPARATKTITLGGVVQGAQQWAQENLDTNFLNALPAPDDQTVQQFFAEFPAAVSGRIRGGPRRVAGHRAHGAVPLQSREATQPYAAWLAAQMDYLDVADQIRIDDSRRHQLETNAPPSPLTNPPPQVERELWVKRVSVRPWPDAAKEYVPLLKPVFIAQKMPPELVWVAEVESSFDRRALSPAGAAGLFQLMPDTAKRFGLSLFPRDQRYQAEPSATASAEYLKSLYARFQDWRLALAAYNAGEGAVQKLLDRYKAQSYDDIATHLPAETQMYVPRVEAVLLRREGAKLEQLPAPL